MSLRQSLRRLIYRSSMVASHRAQRGRRRPNRFERLEDRAMLTSVSGDFDGDGFDDLVIGSPNDSVGGDSQAGSVQVLYGSPTGLTSTGNRRFTLDSTNMLGGGADANEHFGKALAVGDFDGDGYDDLAIGAPDEIVDGVGAGAVHILYGSRHGLLVQGNQRFHLNASGINGIAEAGDEFGSSLAAGDFNNDGRDDLAVGVPGKAVDGLNNAGAVNIIYGRKSGLSGANDQQWTQSSTGVDGAADTDDRFGHALAVGDFNGNSRDDLAIGIIGEDINAKNDAGAVYIMYGRRPEGLQVGSDEYRHSDIDGVEGEAIADGEFGFALAAGDFNDDSRDDLAVGAPAEEQTTTGTKFKSGAVHVFLGTGGGTAITGNKKWDKGIAGLAEVPTDTDRFGSALTVGQINRNRTDDLIIGIPGNTSGAGTIRVLFGSGAGLSPTGTVSMNQASAAISGSTAEADDRFGSSLAIGDYNGDTLMDVAVGVPGDQDNSIKSGSVNVFYANTSTLGTAGAQLWLPGKNGLPGTADADDQFGAAVG